MDCTVLLLESIFSIESGYRIMAISNFPPVEYADEYGLLAVGGDLEVESLLCAYRSGVFPWPLLGGEDIPWFAPPKRALLFIDEYRVPRSLRKIIDQQIFDVVVDRDTPAVIRECAVSTKRKDSGATWITTEMIEAYTALYRAGYCHSVESYIGERLVGGLYGVSIGGMFAGESMFYLEPNASKVAFHHLVELLKAEGAKWIDCQQLTPLLKSFGAREVPRSEFMRLLEPAQSSRTEFFR